MEAGNLFQFGPFCLDARERVLLRDGRLVPLAPKAVSTLLVLVRNMGHVVEKDVLMAEVWPHEYVEEGNLAQHVFMLRRALGDNPRYIETIPRRGYRFLDAVSGIKPPFESYAEHSEVYQAYLRGRFYWSKHTRVGLEQAITCFQNAITLGPNFALAYAGIVDCYLRLATNYLPLEILSTIESVKGAEFDETLPEVQASIALRCEWDSKIANRESRRATELKYDNLGVHQWQAAYLFSRSLYEKSLTNTGQGLESIKEESRSRITGVNALSRFQYLSPTVVEEVQVSCVVARTQIETGNFDAAFAVLERWWTMGEWPRLDALSPYSSGDLLYTAGVLAGGMASTRQVPKGQKHAEALLSGAIGLFEQLGSKTLSAEGRIELAYCYYREGMFDLARSTLMAALDELSDRDRELKGLSLIRLATFECHAGHISNSLTILKDVTELADLGPWVIARYHLQLATVLSDARNEQASEHFEKAIHNFEAIGNHRYTAIAANNYGLFLYRSGRFDDAETHLRLARALFDGLADKVRRAQVDESLAQLHLAAQQFDLAEQAISWSVETLETGGEEALLAESLTTQGRILSRMGRQREAKRVLDRAYAVAERCGDREGAARALLTEVEEMCGQFQDDERVAMRSQLNQLLADSQVGFTLERLRKCQELLSSVDISVEAI
jgi:DNA-binding winged helix-turn-helix (wHTH) protein/predicted negative regulator of RcsB-dependent stress response